MQSIIDFLYYSSKNPGQTSLTVKSAAVALIPFFMHTYGLVCQLGHSCMTINPTALEAFADALAAIVFYALSLISALGMAWGLLRKGWRTWRGENVAIG